MTKLNLKREIGGILECTIGATPISLKRVAGHYDYDDNKTRINCPICGGLGIPWGGLFHCEGVGGHKAVISTGQCFKIVKIEGQNS